MRIGLRILLGYFLIVGLAGWFVLNVFVEEVKPGVRETLEDTLIDTAQLLAELVADDVAAGTLQQAALVTRMHNYAQRSVDIKISGIRKHSLDYRITITNAQGIVLFDTDQRAVGQDYSHWNDVLLTLQGKYGARMSRDVPGDDTSTVMHVAAPIRKGSSIIGVLTVAKPIATIQPFIERSQRKILKRGGWLMLGSLLIGLGFSWWLNRALGKLQRYVRSVEAGDKVQLPALGKHEIGALGLALEAMRVRLEGKQYVEELMHTLAHELKSPIAAIQGSAELLGEALPAPERARFLANIIEQNQRQKQLIDKLLALIKLEKQQHLDSVVDVDMRQLAAQLEQDFSARLAAKDVRLACHGAPLTLRGDALLLRQALGNLLDNAIDFSPPGTAIALSWSTRADGVAITLRDHGPGIPAYAQPRIFERFYSLARPNAARSTGLGLPFVREVALLHGGTVAVCNDADGGACAHLHLPS